MTHRANFRSAGAAGSSASRVAMTVWNEFLTDARVTKEAETLVAAGYAVTVIAIHTPGKTESREMHSSGFEVVRVAKAVPIFLRAIFMFPYYVRVFLARARRKLMGGELKKPEPPSASSYMRRFVSAIGMTLGSWRMMRAAMRSGADVYHVHDANTLLAGWIASRLTRKPFVYDAHEISTDREGYGGLSKAVYFIEKRLMPEAADTITTTDMRADHFVAAYDISRPTVLQNRPRFQSLPEERRMRFELGIAPDRFIVLYQGGLQPGRGLRNLVSVAAEIPEADFVLIGGGRQAPELVELVARHSLQGRVHIVPTVPLRDLPSYTADADIGVQVLRNTCLNHWTTDSNKLFEYIMSGVPVVASNFPEISKVVNSGPYGLLVEPDNLNQIGTAIRRMIGDESFRLQCRRRCLDDARKWSWEAQEHALLALYERVLPRAER